MIPRKQLDISPGDFGFAFAACIRRFDREALPQKIANAWDTDAHPLTCLSVRSGFDAVLTALQLPKGSEIIMSHLNIRDMSRIIKEHGLVPVPVEVDMNTLSVGPEDIRTLITKKTRAILIAHLFGSRMPMTPIIAIAKEHNLLVFEDAAQAFSGPTFAGHPESDICFFSFGPIKTATALGGGVLQIKRSEIFREVQKVQRSWPMQSKAKFFGRCLKYALLSTIGRRPFYGAFTAVCRLFGTDHERVFGKSVRGFNVADFFTAIRHQPSIPLLALIHRRLTTFDSDRLAKRMRIGKAFADHFSPEKLPGQNAEHHSFWVFPVYSSAPDQLVDHLWSKGFDATRGQSSMTSLLPSNARTGLEDVVYLPVYPEVPLSELDRLTTCLNSFEEEVSPDTTPH